MCQCKINNNVFHYAKWPLYYTQGYKLLQYIPRHYIQPLTCIFHTSDDVTPVSETTARIYSHICKGLEYHPYDPQWKVYRSEEILACPNFHFILGTTNSCP